ncbi:hypothetical protein HC928_03995 [bacterium]|nr:hypothetical protein [bacterium]
MLPTRFYQPIARNPAGNTKRVIAQEEELRVALAQNQDRQKIPALLPPSAVAGNKIDVLPISSGVAVSTMLRFSLLQMDGNIL